MALKSKQSPELAPLLQSIMHELLPSELADREAFCLRLQEIYGAEVAADVLNHMRRRTHRCFWLNPLCPSSLQGSELGGERVGELPTLFSVDINAPLPQHAAASAGQLYIQNPSSYFAVQALAPQVDEQVLDLAAAPGGKTIAIAARMNNSGRVAAVEPIRGRFHRMQANLSRCGVTNVQFYMRDGRGVGRAVPDRFDRVLLDAPCSSESRMRWQDIKTFQHWSLRKVRETQRSNRACCARLMQR